VRYADESSKRPELRESSEEERQDDAAVAEANGKAIIVVTFN
jgi:hypothetical protein